MLTWALSLLNLDSILMWLAQKAGLVGALSLYRFKQLLEDNPGIQARFTRKQAEAALLLPNATGADKLKWVVESIAAEMGEVGNDALVALLYGFSTALWIDTTTPPVAAQPQLPPVKVPVKEA